MFFIVLRKMVQNKWLSICLLLGFILAVATVSSIPMFSQGASFNEYKRALRESQGNTGVYPGRTLISKSLYMSESQKYMDVDKMITVDLTERLDLPVQTSVKYLKTDYRNIYLFKTGETPMNMSFASLSNLGDHVTVLEGRMNNPGITDNTLEVVITSTDMVYHHLALNKPYTVECGTVAGESELTLKIVVVGIVEPTSKEDYYWYYNFIETNQKPVFYADQDTLMKALEKEDYIATNAQWYIAYDYNKITLEDMDSIYFIARGWGKFVKAKMVSQFDMPIVSTFVKYTQSEKTINNVMWLFSIPVFVIIAFYILMIAKLIIDYDKNEIVLITSRGGGKLHILKGYLMQGLIIGSVSLIIGPFLGILICMVIGSSNSFMEFTNRKAIPTVLNGEVYLFSIITIIAIIAVMLITATLFSNTSIVKFKQGKGRSQNRNLALRTFLGINLLAISLYWLHSYKSLSTQVVGLIPYKGGMPIDPILFLNAALFIIGAGLFLTSLFPFLVRLLFLLAKKFLPPSIYTAFIQVGRSAGQEQFLMLFIVLTLSIGIFSANSARTINMNATDTLHYQTGADLTVTNTWKHIEDENAPTSNDIVAASNGSAYAQAKIDDYKKRAEMGLLTDSYIEPDFNQYLALNGVESATKVYVEEGKNIFPKLKDTQIRFLAITTNEFGKVAWFRPQLLMYHWYEYLNLLAEVPNGVLLSSSFIDRGIDIGDEIMLKVGLQDVPVIVCDFVDYWPSFMPQGMDGFAKGNKNYMIIGNFGYVFNTIPIRPYEVWINKKPGVSTSDILNEMKSKGIEPFKYTDIDAKIAKLKMDPAILSTNGSLTLGFILTIIICLSGFLIYWVISLKKRSLQFGIMRAMGISSKSVIGMLSFEHVLISGSAILAGISVGALTSRIFIPIYELFYNKSVLLPFRIISKRADYTRLYGIVCIMLLTALAILFVITRNIKVTQAIKLGED